jgi:hypothetical protein
MGTINGIRVEGLLDSDRPDGGTMSYAGRLRLARFDADALRVIMTTRPDEPLIYEGRARDGGRQIKVRIPVRVDISGPDHTRIDVSSVNALPKW